MEKSYLLGELQLLLGTGQKRSRENFAFHCPFCNHKKPKLEVNLHTNDKGQNHWACWVCQTRGTTIRSLLKQLSVPREKAIEILKFVHKGTVEYHEGSFSVQLPKEFTRLSTASTTSFIENKIRRYLYARGLTDNDFLKYHIGYCTTGEYGGRIILPSFDSSNRLNYFTGRDVENSRFKYKNPEVTKDMVMFENLINWNCPIILCEGPFDAIAIKRNAIPVLGKTIPEFLLKRLIEMRVKKVFIALDGDAIKTALRYSEQLESYGIEVYLVKLDKKDPSDLGFEQFTKLISHSKKLDLTSLLEYRLNNL